MQFAPLKFTLCSALAALILLTGSPIPLPSASLLWSTSTAVAKSKLEQEKMDKQKKLQRIQQLKKQVILKEKRVAKNIIRNQQRIESTKTNLKEKSVQLEEARGNLTSLERELDIAVSEQKKLSDDVGKRLRSFYMGEQLGMLSLLLDAVNISNFMDRLYYQQRIYEQDKELVKQYFERTKRLQKQKEQLAWQKDRLASNIQAIHNYQRQLQESIVLDKMLVQKLKTSQKAYDAAEAQLKRESYQIQLQIQRSTQGVKGPVAGSTGRFIKPVSAPITSNFGYRVHPVYRTRKFHAGTDFGSPRGTPIKAADGGKVIHAGWRGGYGKVVIINHGNMNGINVTTLYAHMSNIAVSNGQNVHQGQVVGNVGTTGLSTGPHLHFEVRENGKPSNPMKYLR